MSDVDIQRVGDSVVLKIDGWTILLARDDAMTVGLGLYKIAALGADALDDPVADGAT